MKHEIMGAKFARKAESLILLMENTYNENFDGRIQLDTNA